MLEQYLGEFNDNHFEAFMVLSGDLMHSDLGILKHFPAWQA